MNVVPRNLAIIGSSGFIGSSLSKALLSITNCNVLNLVSREQVSIFDSTTTPTKMDHMNWLKSKYFREIDIVIYLAWDSTPYSTLFSDAHSNNLNTLASYLNIFSKVNLKQFIFVSSAGAIYKTKEAKTFTELTELNIDSRYGQEKIAAEDILLERLAGNIKLHILRPSNVYGIGQSLKRGMGIIPHLLQSIKSNSNVVFYEPLSSQRDYLHIADFNSALILLLNKNINSGIYNISSGINTSLERLVALIAELSDGKIRYEMSVKLDANVSSISSEKFRLISGWSDKTSLAKGLKLTLDLGQR